MIIIRVCPIIGKKKEKGEKREGERRDRKEERKPK
jgi:hypothetical protein